MKRMVSNCVGCTSLGLYCQGNGCPNYNPIPEYLCDECGDEVDPSELYVYDGKELCSRCLLGHFETVEEQE